MDPQGTGGFGHVAPARHGTAAGTEESGQCPSRSGSRSSPRAPAEAGSRRGLGAGGQECSRRAGSGGCSAPPAAPPPGPVPAGAAGGGAGGSGGAMGGGSALRLLLLGCWVLSLGQILLRCGRPGDEPGPFTIITIHGGPAPGSAAPRHEGTGAPAGGRSPGSLQRYQDENENLGQPKTQQAVTLQPWADGSESLQSEAERFLTYISTPQLPCSRALSQAGLQDFTASTAGAWRVCLDHMPTGSLKLQQERCLVYTFSMVKRGFEFSQRMSEMQCQVHSFGLTPYKQTDLWQKGQVQHHALWLDWHERRPVTSLQRRRCPSKRLNQIMQDFGHKKIDVLEADLASAEWKILESILVDGTVAAVHQLILAIHLHWPGFEVSGSEAAVVRYWYSLLKALEARGFHLFHSFKDLQKPQLFLHKELFNASSSYTLSWVNTYWMY
ncbi:LOW QUALITY PROTEIN: putative methyltransferase-like protein 24 [Chelonoidis abingdonii]|uniref:LOW QUALITY PROTEIN: putative methyltransferase-like protein 24 n=1 Tax=Chelonoidis abingdonii TaxID=106734 RepID=UPI003F4998A9